MIIQVLLADDHQIVREGLRSLLEKHPNIKVVGEATDGIMAVRDAIALQPHVVVMDISMPQLNGIEATRQIIANAPHCKVIALSVHEDKHFIIEMMRIGASGYLLKTGAFDELVRAIETVMDGQFYLSPHITRTVIDACLKESGEREEASIYSLLTAREREILQLLAEGHSTRDIASRLSISHKTVDVHRQNMMEKLHISGLAELVKFAIREGIVSLEN